MTALEDSAAGIEAAAKAILALADGNEGEALAALNACSHAEAVWAASYLLTCLREATSTAVNHNPRRLAAALKAGAAGAVEDAVLTAVGLIVEDEHHRIT